jgi:hypothetical protein
MTHHRIIDHMTREDIIDVVHRAKCLKLKGLKLDKMTKEDIILHLQSQKCPEIKKLMKPIQTSRHKGHEK